MFGHVQIFLATHTVEAIIIGCAAVVGYGLRRYGQHLEARTRERGQSLIN